jgi:multicomponent Na+:H+ antiporter subunit F
MTAAEIILALAIWLAFVILGIAFLLTVWRVIKGPTLADRVVALDMLTGIVIGFIALIAIRTGFTLYIDIAISLGLVAFLATVAFARFILSRGDVEPSVDGSVEESPPGTAAVSMKEKKKRAPAKKAAQPRRANK